MKTKILIITFFLFNCTLFAQSLNKFVFEFKDGTIVHGKIYCDPPSILYPHSINERGLTIETQGKIYIHHYPSHKIINHYDNGVYETQEVPTMFAPPNYLESFPAYGSPTCCPTRINFYYFNKKTLKSLYNAYSRDNTPFNQKVRKGIALAYNKNVHSNNFEKSSVAKTKDWQRRVENDFGKLIKYQDTLIREGVKGQKGWIRGKNLFKK